MRQLLVPSVPIVLQATKDEHGVLNVWEFILIVVTFSMSAIVQVHPFVASFILTLFPNLLPICVSVLGKVGHPKTVILTRIIHDIVEFVPFVLLLFVASTFFMLPTKYPLCLRSFFLGEEVLALLLEHGLFMSLLMLMTSSPSACS